LKVQAISEKKTQKTQTGSIEAFHADFA